MPGVFDNQKTGVRILFGVFIAIIWIAASRTRRIAAWIAAGEPIRGG